jgi:hypothetical protein
MTDLNFTDEWESEEELPFNLFDDHAFWAGIEDWLFPIITKEENFV